MKKSQSDLRPQVVLTEAEQAVVAEATKLTLSAAERVQIVCAIEKLHKIAAEAIEHVQALASRLPVQDRADTEARLVEWTRRLAEASETLERSRIKELGL